MDLLNIFCLRLAYIGILLFLFDSVGQINWLDHENIETGFNNKTIDHEISFNDRSNK